MIKKKREKKKIINIVFVMFLLILLVALQYYYAKIKKVPSISNNFIVYADTTKTLNIKLRISFPSDIDTSGVVDGRDLALFSYFFGKTESEYSSNKFRVNPDINRDKIVDGDDLVILGSDFGLSK